MTRSSPHRQPAIQRLLCNLSCLPWFASYLPWLNRGHGWGSCSSTGRKYLSRARARRAARRGPYALLSCCHAVEAFRWRHRWFTITGGIRSSIASVSDYWSILIIGGFRPYVVTDHRSYRSHPLSQILGRLRSSVNSGHRLVPIIVGFGSSIGSDHRRILIIDRSNYRLFPVIDRSSSRMFPITHCCRLSVNSGHRSITIIRRFRSSTGYGHRTFPTIGRF